MNKKQFLYLLLFLIIGITLIPFFKIGFTTGDDLEYYIRMQKGGLFPDANIYAQGAGRFSFLITMPLYHLPYLFDNFYFTKIIQYVFLLISFVLFVKVINEIFRSKTFAILIFLLLIAFLTVTPHYFVPIISYPFFFTFSFSIFLTSILLLLKYNETKRYRYLIFSAILFFASLLFYETYLIFGFFVGCFIIIRNFVEDKKNMLFKTSFYKEVLPFIGAAAIYIVIYFAYRCNIQTDEEFYAGSSFAKNFSIANFFKILWNYNKAAFPTFVYHASQDIINQNSLLIEGHQHNFWYILRNSPTIVIINAILQGVVFFFLCKDIKTNISWRKIGFSVLIVTIISFSAHILLACSEKYNASGWHTHNGYVTTFYSYFCITLIIGLIIYAFLKLFYRNKYMRYVALFLCTLVLFLVSVIIGYSNEHLSQDWQKSQNRFILVDEALKANLFETIDSNAFVYDAQLSKTISKTGHWICDGGFRWKDYVFIKSGQKIDLSSNLNRMQEQIQNNPQQEIYYIARYEDVKSMDALLVLSKIEDNTSINFDDVENPFGNAVSKSAIVYYYSVNKHFRFEFVVPQLQQTSAFYINNQEYGYVNQGVNILEYQNERKKEKITTFTLKCEEPFLVDDFLISTLGSTHAGKH